MADLSQADPTANRDDHRFFEVSWEICNKVGGIHTVISSRAMLMTGRFGDNYVAIGPWLPSGEDGDLPFDDDASMQGVVDACSMRGVAVRVGRWRIPGRPRTILVDSSRLLERKDEILAQLWESDGIDSLAASWEFVEPTLFSVAAANVIDAWHGYFADDGVTDAVAYFHEWLSGAGVFELARLRPGIGRVFVTHATVVGRSLASRGHIVDSIGELPSPTDTAREMGVIAKHSMETAAARRADVFATVSRITAEEATAVLRRRPDLVVPNGLDTAVIDELLKGHDVASSRRVLRELCARFLGTGINGDRFVATSGRYEFHNKGIDLFLDALADLNGRPGEPIVALILVPAGAGGPRRELLKRMAAPPNTFEGPVGISTHELHDECNDPIAARCRRLGLDNALGSRVRVVHIPIYLHGNDGLVNLPYEAVLSAADLSVFPSFYEPWGYTPQESIAVGVPTITSDLAGFGRWALEDGVTPRDGVAVLKRHGVEESVCRAELGTLIDRMISMLNESEAELKSACRETVTKVTWPYLLANYEQASAEAIAVARQRATGGRPGAATLSLPVMKVEATPHGDRPNLVYVDVAMQLPVALSALNELAANFWWCWDPDATELFHDLDEQGWADARSNPTVLLRNLSSERVAEICADVALMARVERVVSRFHAYMSAADTTVRPCPPHDLSPEKPAAYFSMEFGIHESLKIYSGGLGVLAGDHLKTASDMNLPLVGVGLFYASGYADQRINEDGTQIALPQSNDLASLPLTEVVDEDGEPVIISVEQPNNTVFARILRVAVGRITLYLLDSNIDENSASDRRLCDRLYIGDREMRLRQELLLGVGGVRALRAIGVGARVFHLNEGHSAFSSLERVARNMEEAGLSYKQAVSFVRQTTLYTTHTPVAAGHDSFSESLLRYWCPNYTDLFGISWRELIGLGQAPGERGVLHMSYLAANFAAVINGVSEIHGRVSKGIFHPLMPGLTVDEVPITAVTNGIHVPSWASREVSRRLAPDGHRLCGPDYEDAAKSMSDSEIWQMRQSCHRHFVGELTRLFQHYLSSRPYASSYLRDALDYLNPCALTIGYARRVAPYKRLGLLFSDVDRLARLVNNPERPVRIYIAGKAHPQDQAGADILAHAVRASKRPELSGRVVIIEGYDMFLGRLLVQGVDLWLNTPRPPLEASGTSGMKAAANGVLNLSTRDGWFAEGYNEKNSWQIGGRMFDRSEVQDAHDAEELYRLLEDEVVNEYYDRNAEGAPTRWVARVRENLATMPAQFSSERMVGDYVRIGYSRLSAAADDLSANDHAGSRELAERHRRIREGFPELEVVTVEHAQTDSLTIGDTVRVGLNVRLGPLAPEDIRAEFVYGYADRNGELRDASTIALELESRLSDGVFHYTVKFPLTRAGRFATGVRVRAAMLSPYDDVLADLTCWA